MGCGCGKKTIRRTVATSSVNNAVAVPASGVKLTRAETARVYQSSIKKKTDARRTV